MGRKIKRWTKKEVEFLKKNYNNFKTKDLAKKLNRNYHSVKHKLNRLNLNKGFKFCKGSPPKWTKKEEKILIKLLDKSIREISKILNKNETQIRYAIRKFKIKRRDPSYWSKKEVDILKKNINKPYSYLKKFLPKRSIKSIIGKKDKLKLKRKSKFYWSDEEDLYLIKNYHKKLIDELAKRLKKTNDAIHARRIRLIKKGYHIKDKKEFLSKYWKKAYKENKLLKSKHSQAIKNLWKNKSFRERQKISIQNKFKDPKFFEAHKKAFLERRNSKDFKKKQKKIASERMKLRHKNPIEHKKILMNLRKNPSNQQLYAFNYIKNKLKEKVICNDWTILDNIMEVDISIPKLRIAIEWDGAYWHKNKGAKEKDRRKNGLLIHKGWRFIRIKDIGLSKKEIEDRCKLTLSIIEKYKNSDEYNYTGGFYI